MSQPDPSIAQTLPGIGPRSSPAGTGLDLGRVKLVVRTDPSLHVPSPSKLCVSSYQAARNF